MTNLRIIRCTGAGLATLGPQRLRKEAWAQFAARVEHFWTQLQQEAEAPVVPRILLVTHGGVIRQLLAQIIEGVTFYTAAAPAPGEVTVLRLRRDGGCWHMAEGN